MPFAIDDDKRKKDRKRSGHKGGHKGQYRQRPDDSEIDQHLEVPLPHCPDWGEPLSQHSEQTIEQTLLEIPPIKPQLIRLTTYRNHFVALRAVAIVAWLNKGLGLPMRKSCQVMKQVLGLKLSAGGLSQALDGMAQRVEPDYHTLLEQLHDSPVFYTDETRGGSEVRAAAYGYSLTMQAPTIEWFAVAPKPLLTI